LEEPLNPSRVRKLVGKILDEGEVEFSGHALEEMAKDDLTELDVINVLRGGRAEPGEFERGTWRYRMLTSRICVVVAFRSDDWLVVVTAWRE